VAPGSSLILILTVGGCSFRVAPVAVSFDEDLGGVDLSVSMEDLSEAPPDLADLAVAPDLSVTPADLRTTVTPVLTVMRATAPNSINLTSDGTLDWEDYGLNGATTVNRKNGVTAAISHTTTGGLNQYGFFPTAISWSDGTPTATANNTNNGVYITGINNGFTWVVPADTTQRVLRLYIGEFRGEGTMVAHLSDGSLADVVVTDKNNGGLSMSRFEIVFRATSAGTLTVSWRLTADSGGGATDFQAATYF
jgi:hypothetical protein